MVVPAPVTVVPVLLFDCCWLFMAHTSAVLCPVAASLTHVAKLIAITVWRDCYAVKAVTE
ncbi:hypothetical protein GCM10009665_21610 [Kitasatospora nipponensis]|uniref:Secreted protein n=1 Tax=Kitasatospora nipponensis TaxID=258049 RepID=A0ABP4GMV2_9ACTN